MEKLSAQVCRTGLTDTETFIMRDNMTKIGCIAGRRQLIALGVALSDWFSDTMQPSKTDAR